MVLSLRRIMAEYRQVQSPENRTHSSIPFRLPLHVCCCRSRKLSSLSFVIQASIPHEYTLTGMHTRYTSPDPPALAQRRAPALARVASNQLTDHAQMSGP